MEIICCFYPIGHYIYFGYFVVLGCKDLWIDYSVCVSDVFGFVCIIKSSKQHINIE